jgi:tetratricopeptide (TPR) repeat protein
MERQPLPVSQTVSKVGKLLLGVLLATAVSAASMDELLVEAQNAETKLDSARALELYRRADAARPGDSFILQKIARQYSDLVLDQPTDAERKRYAQTALEYAQRAVAVNPRDPVNVLSLAVAHGKLAVYSDTKVKLQYSRLVKEEAERALALDPNYAWAHHVLGRWHYEVASLGAASRWVVRLLYGGLPGASQAEAVAHLRRAVALEPDELNHHLELGFALAVAGDKAAARQAWERGLAMPERGKHDAAAKQRAREALAALQ